MCKRTERRQWNGTRWTGRDVVRRRRAVCVWADTFLPRRGLGLGHAHCRKKGRDRSPAGRWPGWAHSVGVGQLFIFLLALSDTDCALPADRLLCFNYIRHDFFFFFCAETSE